MLNENITCVYIYGFVVGDTSYWFLCNNAGNNNIIKNVKFSETILTNCSILIYAGKDHL